MHNLPLALATTVCLLIPTAPALSQEHYVSIYNNSSETIVGIYFGYYSPDNGTDDVGPNMIDATMYPTYEVTIGPLYACAFDILLVTSDAYSSVVYGVDLCGDSTFQIDDYAFSGE